MGFGGFGSFLINLMLQRGFSTRFDAELDMRMSQKNDLNAYKVVNEYDDKLKASVLRLWRVEKCSCFGGPL
jgi:16S rRNA C1402 N4-methylase RsmH